MKEKIIKEYERKFAGRDRYSMEMLYELVKTFLGEVIEEVKQEGYKLGLEDGAKIYENEHR